MTKYALISVSDKSNLEILVDYLYVKDYTILSTGGTFKYIYDNFERARDSLVQVSDWTGASEILNGRVKTLHPKIYGGILYDSRFDTDGIEKIDLVVANLYPFESSINSEDVTEEKAIENIDIGGVSLIRAAAKNYKNTRLLTCPFDYYEATLNFDDTKFWKSMAIKGFDHVTWYDSVITNYFCKDISYRRYSQENSLKYGCNPYQGQAGIFSINYNKLPFQILNGNPGYINVIDAIQSRNLVYELTSSTKKIAAASFKHTAPAGVALDSEVSDDEVKFYRENNINNYSNVARAFIKARNCDPLSSFGDFIAISGTIDSECARLIAREVSDGIIARDYTTEALEILKTKKKGAYIILKCNEDSIINDTEYRELGGLCLRQETNRECLSLENISGDNIVTKDRSINESQKHDMILATITLKYTPSNSIAISSNGVCIGIGAGQQNRVDCIKIAGEKANLWRLRHHPKVLKLYNLFKEDTRRQDKINSVYRYIRNDFNSEIEKNNWITRFNEIPEEFTENDKKEFLDNENRPLILSSDAFMPFRDNIDTAIRYNINSFVQPGGSVADESVIDACNEYNCTMIFTGKRFFLH